MYSINKMTHTVQLLVTCIIDTLYPATGESAVRVLNHAGCKVEFPGGQTCCGQPAYNAGMRQQARKTAIHTIKVLEATRGDIIIPSGSCCAMIRKNYLDLFAGDSIWFPRAKILSERVFEFSEYLVDVLGVIDLGASLHTRAAYHSSCHLLRELGINHQPRALLQTVSGLDLVELPASEECCGFGGVFSLEHPEISSAMLERKIANIEASQSPVVIVCDAGCITNINGGLHRKNLKPRATHIAEILDNF